MECTLRCETEARKDFGIPRHCPEFEHCELAAMKPGTCLPEECGTRAGESYSKADRHQPGKQNQKAHGRSSTIHARFGDTTPTAEDRLVDVQQR